jgi:hypothetical protein
MIFVFGVFVFCNRRKKDEVRGRSASEQARILIPAHAIAAYVVDLVLARGGVRVHADDDDVPPTQIIRSNNNQQKP